MKKNILINDESVAIDIISQTIEEVSFIYLDKKYSFNKMDISKKIISSGSTFVVDGLELNLELSTNTKKRKTILEHGQMIAPMPGKILKILISEGADVMAGAPLVVMEAMKMEHTIKASKNGKVTKIHFQENSQVVAGVELVTIC